MSTMKTARVPDSRKPASLAELNRMLLSAAPGVTGGRRAVPGEGPIRACLALVGEQPGDREDITGRPFVGPAGAVLDRALAAAGIDRERCYLTNAVKHFKFVARGKRRIHQKPTTSEIKHYRWWLEEELRLVAPLLVVALGATAAHALAGRPLPIAAARGAHELLGWPGFITLHPSYVLRQRDSVERQNVFNSFAEDLRAVRRLAERLHLASA